MVKISHLVLSTVLGAVPVAAQFPCWETNLGTNLGLADDALSGPQALGFTFPFAGGTITDIDISSNGFIYLGAINSGSNGCCNGSVSTLLGGDPRIAPVWMDLNPSAGGGVYFNALPGRAVVTWDQVPEFGSSTNPCTVQLQMDASGSFQIVIRSLTVPTTHDLLVGVSQGNGAVDPGESDLSTGAVVTAGNPTVYEYFDRTESRDVTGKAFTFLSDGAGGYIVVENTACRQAGFSTYGVGCPLRGPAHYELFDISQGEAVDLNGLSLLYQSLGNGRYLVQSATSQWESNFGTNLGLGDDALSGPQPLGFTASVAGVSISTIDVSSNGFVYLGSHSGGSGCCNGSLTALLDDDPRIAMLWQDLNPSTVGGVYFNALPGKAVVTFDQVPEFGQTTSNTFQLQIFSDGSFQMEWVAASNATHTALVGFSAGMGSDDPAESDLSSGVPEITYAGSNGPVVLDAAPGSVPAVGAAFTLDVTNLPANSLLGFMVLGFTKIDPGTSLASLGMESCNQYLSLDDNFLFAIAPGASTASITLNIPNQAYLVGLDAFVQAAVFVPGINQLGIVASNGGAAAIGN